MAKAHHAKTSGATNLELWGSGKPMREFLYVDDLAEACVFLLKTYSEAEPINVGFGSDVTIRALAETIADIVGFKGGLTFDTSKPDGTPRKLMSSARINALGWKASTDLRLGIAKTYEWYRVNSLKT